MRSRAGVLIGAALAIGAAGATPTATAQDIPDVDISAKARAFPSKAGTRKNPRGLMIKAKAKLTTEPGFERPIVTGLELLMGPGLIWNTDDASRCSKRVLDRKGPKGCPEHSIVGHAKATAFADTVVTRPDVVIINGGPKRHFAYVTLYHPTLVKETIVIKVKKLKRGKWTQRESLTVPESLRIVAGVPIQFTGIDMTIGGKPYARKFTASTFCPKGGWKYKATAHLLFGSLGETSKETISGSIPCRR